MVDIDPIEFWKMDEVTIKIAIILITKIKLHI